jgi:hypothetical protein
MDEPPATQFDEQLRLLERLSEQLRSGQPPDRFEIDGALERGFGRLIALEAELQRVIQSADDAAEGHETDLRYAIEVLREALNDLRTESSPPGPPRIGYGFVLPDSGSRSGPSPAEGIPPGFPGSLPGAMHQN